MGMEFARLAHDLIKLWCTRSSNFYPFEAVRRVIARHDFKWKNVFHMTERVKG